MTQRRTAVRIVLLAGAALLAAGCAINPATGKREFSLVSESQEIAMGREADQVIRVQMGEYGSDDLQDYVQRIGERLAAVSERPHLDWTFRVVDDPTVNAFALPGGYIYITRGIMAHLNNEAELATVVGHEIGHVTARHSADQITKAQLAQVGLGLGTVLGPDWARQLGPYAEMGVGLMFLKFSRDDERQADDLGLRYLLAADYDARPAPGVFDILEQVSAAAGGDRVPGWMSTHPAPENREVRLSQQVSSLERDFAGAKLGREEYFAHIDGVVFGPDPRQGYFEEQRFLHPELELRLDFPAGWKTVNGREAVAAMSPEQDAVVVLTHAAEPTVEQALEKFLGQEGIAAGATWRSTLNRYSVASRAFRAATSQATVRGLAVFLRHRDATYRLLGYAVESRWTDRRGAIEGSLGSFDRLTDPAALAVQPARLTIVDVRSAMTLAEFAERNDASVPVETLARINHLDPAARLEAGRAYKVVQGGRTP